MDDRLNDRPSGTGLPLQYLRALVVRRLDAAIATSLETARPGGPPRGLGRAWTRGGLGRDEYRREYFASRREYHAYRNIVWSAGERVLEQQTGELGMLRDRGVERHPRWVVSILRRFDRVGVIQRTVPADSFNFAIGPVAARHIDMFRPEQERLHEDYREQVDERIVRIMVSRLVRLQGGRAAMTQELLLDLESRACAMDNRPMAGSEHQMAPKT
jgi:hypothetical protein